MFHVVEGHQLNKKRVEDQTMYQFNDLKRVSSSDLHAMVYTSGKL